MTNRQLSTCSHKAIGTNCKKCGIYMHIQDPAFKTNLYESATHCSSHKYLKHLRKRKCPQVKHREITQSTYYLLEAICDKFQYNLQTLTLGIYVFVKSCPMKQDNPEFWASAALLVASKGIELDKKVPYLNRYQRYADKEFSQADYQQAEKFIFEEMNFDLQYSTFLTFLHFYLTNGIIFKSDNCSYITLKIIEDEILMKAKILIKKGEFVDKNPEQLALSLIKEYRQKHRLNPWPTQLEKLSGFSSSQISILENKDLFQPLKNIENRIKERINLIETIEKRKFSKQRTQKAIRVENSKENMPKHFQSTYKFNQERYSTLRGGSSFSSSIHSISTNNFLSRRI